MASVVVTKQVKYKGDYKPANKPFLIDDKDINEMVTKWGAILINKQVEKPTVSKNETVENATNDDFYSKKKGKKK